MSTTTHMLPADGEHTHLNRRYGLILGFPDRKMEQKHVCVLAWWEPTRSVRSRRN